MITIPLEFISSLFSLNCSDTFIAKPQKVKLNQEK